MMGNQTLVCVSLSCRHRGPSSIVTQHSLLEIYLLGKRLGVLRQLFRKPLGGIAGSD